MRYDDIGETGGIALVERVDVSIVEMWGEIDVALRSEAGAALANALGRNVPVIIDAQRVTFIDSTGIAFLVQFSTIGSREGLRVTLRHAPEAVTDVLEMLGISGLFTSEDDSR